MVAHTCEVAIWSVAYAFVDAASEKADRMYFAFVNYWPPGPQCFLDRCNGIPPLRHQRADLQSTARRTVFSKPR
jgi:hypothetical protein